MKKVFKWMAKHWEGIITGVTGIFVVWVFLSIVEVMCNNLNPDYQYCALNIFTMMMGA